MYLFRFTHCCHLIMIFDQECRLAVVLIKTPSRACQLRISALLFWNDEDSSPLPHLTSSNLIRPMAAGADPATMSGVNRTSVWFDFMWSRCTLCCFIFVLWAFWRHMSSEPSALFWKSLMHFFCSPGCHVYSIFPSTGSYHICSAIIHRWGCRQQTSGEIYADWTLKTLWWIIFPCT